MLGIPGSGLTEEEGRTLARMTASRIFDAYWFTLHPKQPWQMAHEVMEMAATGVLAGRRAELVAWLAGDSTLTTKQPSEGNDAMDWQVLLRMMPCWTRLFGRGTRWDVEGVLRGLDRLAKGAPEWTELYWEMREVDPLPNAHERLEAHYSWASATHLTARHMRFGTGLRPDDLPEIRSEFSEALGYASQIGDARMLNTLLQLYEAVRVVAGFEPFADDPEGPIYRGGVGDVLR